jgi:uncharacterized LabA/DUF88 family protein
MFQQTQSTLEAQVTNGKNFVSLYWDYENINKIENTAKMLINFCQSRGYLVNQNIYAKASIWQQDKGKSKAKLNNLGFTCIEVSLATKNAVDFKLVIDCVAETHNNISTNLFILVSSDGDYETLIRELQNKGKEIIVFYHPNRVSQALIQIATEAYSVEELPELVNNKVQRLDVPSQITYKVAI